MRMTVTGGSRELTKCWGMCEGIILYRKLSKININSTIIFEKDFQKQSAYLSR